MPCPSNISSGVKPIAASALSFRERSGVAN
jgi:hypothetical protein